MLLEGSGKRVGSGDDAFGALGEKVLNAREEDHATR